MKPGQEEITLEIEGFTPATIPMERLARYLVEFSALLGNEDNIHFAGIEKGSVRCKAVADERAVPKVRQRVESVVDGSAPKLAMRAHKAIDDLLAEDNATGKVVLDKRSVIEFPGRLRSVGPRIGPVRRESSLDGQIFQIGGKDDTINVHLRSGTGEITQRCAVSIRLARELLPYFLGTDIRLFGHGDWYRVGDRWEMANFVATSFVELDRKSLQGSIDELQGIFSSVPSDELTASLKDLRGE